MTRVMDTWKYHPSSRIGTPVSESLRSFPREPAMLAYAVRSIAALLLRAWMRIYHRLHIDGLENLPTRGSYILVCNHTSHLDTLCLLASVPLRSIHHCFPAAAADYFFSSLPRSAVSAILINALPFDRKAKGAESLALCSELLKNEGNILILFPEGTRTTTGTMGRFRSGIGRLAAGNDIDIVPCHLEGGLRAWPKGKLFPRPRRLGLRIGRAINYRHLDPGPASVRAVCADLEEHVARLGGGAG
jgi:1-acyl-sn-glycerol-3-phosphate acyltransferase